MILGASGNFFSGLWGIVYRAHGENEFVLWVFSKCLQCVCELK